MTGPNQTHVLIVDDEPDLAELVADVLDSEADDFDVQYVTSASDGLDRLAQNDFDCIVSDYDMPGMDGLDFLDAVREGSCEIPFILFTGKGSEEIASEAITRGVTDYMQKEAGLDQYTVLANRIQNAVLQARVEERIERERRRFRLLVEETSDVILVVGPDGQISYATPSAERILGQPPAELEGTNGFNLVHPDDVDDVQAQFSELIEEPEAHKSAEFRYRRPDGELVWIEVRGRNLLENPVIEGLVIYARDVTERKQQEDEWTTVQQ